MEHEKALDQQKVSLKKVSEIGVKLNELECMIQDLGEGCSKERTILGIKLHPQAYKILRITCLEAYPVPDFPRRELRTLFGIEVIK